MNNNKSIYYIELDGCTNTWKIQPTELPNHAEINLVHKDDFLSESSLGYNKFSVYVCTEGLVNGFVTGADLIRNKIATKK